MSDDSSRETGMGAAQCWRAIVIASAVWGAGFIATAAIAGAATGMSVGGVLLAASIVAAATGFGVQSNLQGISREAKRPLEGLRAAMALPQQAQRWFAGTGMLMSLLMLFVFEISGVLVAMLAVSGMSLSAAVAVALFYAQKRNLRACRESLSLAIEEPGERAKVVGSMPLARKAGFALGACAAVVASVGVTLSLAHAHASQRAFVDEAQARALAAVVEASEEAGFEEAVLQVVGDPRARAISSSFEQVALGSDASRRLGGEASAWMASAIANGEKRGHFDSAETGTRISYQQISRDEVAVVVTSGDALLGGSAPWAALLFIALIAGGCASWLAMAFAGEVRDAVSTLARVTDRMSQGDLRRLQAWESEDELGDLWRSHENMGHAFRQTVHNLADAADRIDAAAAEIEGVSGHVSGTSADQVRRIQQASELMVSINSQVMEVASSAQELNIAVEESSSSILELGAAGDELNETASVLGSKVDEVSGSIEQMVRSVKQVSSSSDGLADAAAETSASMEEMASAMRAVDTTAEATAELSRGVVASAESGQQKVSQTIAGMEAIRDATDTAENVIRGLGARTQEIGAILDVIDDVAEETNLLALNAAIIAAQAGEHGRAFSVVADEIKELADRVLASTKEIGGLIKSVQDESDNAVGAIEVGSRSVGNGVELSAEAGLSLEEITRSSRESGQRIGEIVSAVREQTKAASHVVALMDTVRDGVTAIVSAAADQDRGNEVVYRSAVTMRDVTQQVRRTTEEQSRGFVRIRESIEGVREVVGNINGSLQEQTTACAQVAQFLEQVFERTRSNEDAAGSMSESVHGLIAQAEALRANVSRFQV